MKIYLNGYFSKILTFFIFFISLLNFKTNYLSAEEMYFKEMEIESSTKFDEKKSDLPTNPFEIVEMFRRANSMNDATNPTDAIDDALRSFNIIEQN